MTPYQPVGWEPPRARGTRFFPTIVIAAALIAVAVIGFAGKHPKVPPSPLVGVVTSVDSGGLAAIRGFDLRLADGSTVTLKVGPLENATQFSPSHLPEHQATSEPIRAFYRLDANGIPIVYRLEDASSP